MNSIKTHKTSLFRSIFVNIQFRQIRHQLATSASIIGLLLSSQLLFAGTHSQPKSSSTQTLKLTASPLSYEFYRLKVEAETCSLQLDVVLASIIQHYQNGVDMSSEICFDIGQLATYIKIFDMAIDDAKDEFLQLPTEDRIWFRIPLQDRDLILGACGVVGDPSMPKGDFKTLLKRILNYKNIYNHILAAFPKEPEEIEE